MFTYHHQLVAAHRVTPCLSAYNKRYQLPPDNTKTTDTRRAAFVAQWGDVAVELDALPIDVLKARLQRKVERLLDLGALAKVRTQEASEREVIAKALRAAIG